MRKSKFTESRIIKAINANENGQRVEDLCRELGIALPRFTDGVRSIPEWKPANENDYKSWKKRTASLNRCMRISL